MGALKMAVDGTPIVPKVSAVIAGARGRDVADQGSLADKVSRKVTIACVALAITEQ